MSLCINPQCSNRKNLDNHLFCQTCGSKLLIAERYRVNKQLDFNTYEVFDDQCTKVLQVLQVLTDNHPQIIELFEREARIVETLNHPGIPKIDSFTYLPRVAKDPIHCLIMEKIEGLSLDEYQTQSSPQINQALAWNWLTQLTEILHLLHSNNVFHLNIEPSNIILRPTGQLALINLRGVLDKTVKYLAACTPWYIPLEQIVGRPMPQSDFYSLGLTFVCLLTNKNPWYLSIHNRHGAELKWREEASLFLASKGDKLDPAFADLLDEMTAESLKSRPANTTVILQRLRDMKKISSTSGRKKP